MDDKYIEFSKYFLISNDEVRNALLDMINELGLDKVNEVLSNYKKIKNIKIDIDANEFLGFCLYEFSLSNVLFSILRLEENAVKGFLCNLNYDTKINIEIRPSNIFKTKYYFRFKTYKGKYLLIRTHVYKHGPVSYYDAIKTLDFGDINLIFSHLSYKDISLFSKDHNIINNLDNSRKLRNYVYHHNILFSLGKNELLMQIKNLLKSIPNIKWREYFINKINNLKSKINNIDLSNELLIYINEVDKNEILSI